MAWSNFMLTLGESRTHGTWAPDKAATRREEWVEWWEGVGKGNETERRRRRWPTVRRTRAAAPASPCHHRPSSFFPHLFLTTLSHPANSRRLHRRLPHAPGRPVRHRPVSPQRARHPGGGGGGGCSGQSTARRGREWRAAAALAAAAAAAATAADQDVLKEKSNASFCNKKETVCVRLRGNAPSPLAKSPFSSLSQPTSRCRCCCCCCRRRPPRSHHHPRHHLRRQTPRAGLPARPPRPRWPRPGPPRF
jgi:hypothetical protein